jgi:hypothetical protein
MADDLGVSAIGFDKLSEYFEELLHGYEGKTSISGGLTVTGHTYWVVLEYGSSPAEPDPGPKNEDEFNIIALPTREEIDDLAPGSAYPESKHHSEWYPITARHKKKLFFYDSYGERRFQTTVHHPGVHATGFLRRTVQDSLVDLFAILDELDAELGDDLPDRSQVVKAFNGYLALLLKAVRFATPVGAKEDPREPGFLKDAWRVEYAR